MGIIKEVEKMFEIIRFCTRLYAIPILSIVVCGMLIRQCFQPFFINPEKVLKNDYILKHTEKINLIGKVFTGLVSLAAMILFVLPASLDTIHWVRNDYVYAIVETTTDYNAKSSNAKHGRTLVVQHPEFFYDSKTDQIFYHVADDGHQYQDTISVPLAPYAKGEFYLVKYLPYTKNGFLVYQIDEIEEYKQN